MLKSIYTSEYDTKAIEQLAGGDKIRRATIPIGIHQVADKYGISNICELAAKDIEELITTAKDDASLLRDVIYEYYAHAVDADDPMGKSIVAALLQVHQAFIKNSNFEDLLLSYPVFGADVALALQRSNLLRLLELQALKEVSCTRCHFSFPVNVAKVGHLGSSVFSCLSCGTSIRCSEYI
jgi:hypothetical protein